MVVMHLMFCQFFYALVRGKCSMTKVASFGGMALHLSKNSIVRNLPTATDSFFYLFNSCYTVSMKVRWILLKTITPSARMKTAKPAV